MEGERVSVNFTCQRCLQPVILDDSFTNMDEYARAELARKYQIASDFNGSLISALQCVCFIFQCQSTQMLMWKSIHRRRAWIIWCLRFD